MRVDHHVEYPLARLIKCEHCGANFSGRKLMRLDRRTGERRPVYAYYCNSYQTKGPEVCPSLPLAKEWLESVVVEVIKSRLFGDKAWKEVEDAVHAKVEARRKMYGQSPKVIDAKIGELDRRIRNFYRAIGSGCDPVVMREQIAEANKMKAALEEEARIVRSSDYYVRAFQKNVETLRQFREAFRQSWDKQKPSVQRRVVARFVAKIKVVGRRDLHITYRVPFDNGGLKLLVDEMQAAKLPMEVDGSEWDARGTSGGASDSATMPA